VNPQSTLDESPRSDAGSRSAITRPLLLIVGFLLLITAVRVWWRKRSGRSRSVLGTTTKGTEPRTDPAEHESTTRTASSTSTPLIVFRPSSGVAFERAGAARLPAAPPPSTVGRSRRGVSAARVLYWPIARFVIGLLAFAIVAIVAFLAFFAMLPVAWGWQPVVVVSDSMAPAVRAGDIVVTSPPASSHLREGVVVRFDHPTQDATLMHRIVGVTAEGALRTKGDANAVADSTPVEPSQVRGVARLVVPAIGYAVAQAAHGHGLVAVVIALVFAAAIWASRWGLLAKYEPWHEAPSPTAGPSSGPSEFALGRAAALAGVLVLGSAVATASVSTSTSAATFVTSTSNGGSSLSAASDYDPELDTTSSATGDRVDTLTWSHTVTAGYANRLLVVGISVDADHNATGVTYDGNALAFLGGQTDGPNKSRVELWYLVAPPTGTADVEVSFADAIDDAVVAGATSWRAIHQSTPFGTAVFASGDSATASATVSSATSEIVVDVVSADATSVSVGGGQSEHWNANPDKIGGGGSSEAGAASVTMSWAVSGGADWAIGAVPLKPANP